ncbi:MAG: NADH-quinone oxidoreductase subunit NuoG [Acidobacteriota bacterium]|nr:NADH-quinone oxidoreductase subunit NuoG [Acidobacteriota bacterium]
MADVTFTVDGKKLTAPAGTLLIDACRKAGIEIPSFCYYPGLSLQAACRMCVVRQEKVPKLQTACTTTVAEGQVFITESDEIAQARKATLELLLGNHPLDCPVCDAGGECELQDMTFKYGAGESLYAEAKQHREEQQWSPAVFYDRPRCILCYRCVRMCGEGMDVWALAVENRGARAVIAPNQGDSLNCEQCGMCIDVCPVGALTSGTYRYKTRPWEMKHVSTVCTHCGDGCKVTLGVRSANDGAEIIRADNRDKSGINNDFLCAKGRFGFDFVESKDRLTTPMVRNAAGELKPATWTEALNAAAKKLKEVHAAKGGSAIGVLGSSQTTNEENYLLQKFARTVLTTNNIDHDRTADYTAFADALAGHKDKLASLRETETAPAILLIGGDPTNEHPLLAWNLRTNVRHHKARIYIVNHRGIKLERQAKAVQGVPPNGYKDLVTLLGSDTNELAKGIAQEETLLAVIGQELNGKALTDFVAWALKRGNVRFAYLGDHANSRGAADMGLLPDRLPGYIPVNEPGAFAAEYAGLPTKPGLTQAGMLASAEKGELAVLYAVGANPAGQSGFKPDALKNTFVIVQDLFLTETAALADVVLPAASLYEKTGTVTNTFGDLQLAHKAADHAGVKGDFEIVVRLAGAMGVDVKMLVPFGTSSLTADFGQSRGAQAGEADRHAVWLAAHNLEPKVSPFDPLAVLDEIERLVPGYELDRLNLLGGNDAPVHAALPDNFVPLEVLAAPEMPATIAPTHDTLFTSSVFGRYSKTLTELKEYQEGTLAETAAD